MMTGTSFDMDALARELVDDGDTAELGDGRSVRLRIESDPDTRVSDFPDLWGRIEWVDDRSVGSGRPDGFDGNAEKISLGNESAWWQPPSDVKRSDDGFAQLRSSLRETLESGYVGMVVELLDKETDAYDRPIVRDTASLWGIEGSADGEYRTLIVRDLLSEMLG